MELPSLEVWERAARNHIPLSFDLELTARCNNNCRHCYINVPANDATAASAELTGNEILDIAAQAVELGALWCLITGGEPLLRKDFREIYLGIRRLGLLPIIFTNACLIEEDTARFLARYPPRNVEVTVYGATAEAYERATRAPGSYNRFRGGVHFLLEHKVPLSLKLVITKSNFHEVEAMSRLCRELTGEYARFDPFLHLRYDGDPDRNVEIVQEQLSAAEVVTLEASDPLRFRALTDQCRDAALEGTPPGGADPPPLFRCGAGLHSFCVGPDGTFKLCSTLVEPSCVLSLRQTSLVSAWKHFIPRVRSVTVKASRTAPGCQTCQYSAACPSCPARAYLETGALDGRPDGSCMIAHARKAACAPLLHPSPRLSGTERHPAARAQEIP